MCLLTSSEMLADLFSGLIAFGVWVLWWFLVSVM